jgi:hypothetical protein
LLTECPAHLRDIEIAGLHFELRCSLPIVPKKSDSLYSPFIKPPAQGSFRVPVTIEFNKSCHTEVFPKIFENQGPWTSVYGNGEDYIITRDVSVSDEHSFSVRFNKRFEDVKICHNGKLAEVYVDNPFSYPLDQLLLIHVLAWHEGVLLHSAAFDCNGKAYMFAGRSGAGKSTLSRQLKSSGYEVLSDDRVAVRKMQNTFWAFGTPWSGDAHIALNKGLPLAGIFFISHGVENTITELTSAEAAERFMPVTSIPFYDKEATLNILAFCEDIVVHIPAYELCFKPGIEVVALVEEYVSRQ